MSANSSVHRASCFGSVTLALSSSQTAVRIVLVLPLFALVLRLAYRRRRRRASAAPSHSDTFAHHVAAMHLVWLLGVAASYCGIAARRTALVKAGAFAASIIMYGESFFHALACAEWHLAVVHPVTYRGLRGARGVAARNAAAAAAWLLSLGLMGVSEALAPGASGALLLSFLCVSVSVISYCSLSVVRVLVRPAPAGAAQSRQRPALAVASISAVLWVWLVGCVVSVALVNFGLLRCDVGQTVRAALGWFSLPSSAVAPVLYLHRAGKLWCGRRE